MQKQESSSELRKWEDLDINILKKIFNAIPICDLFNNVSLVCKEWQLGCWNSLFWGQNVLDFSVAAMAIKENRKYSKAGLSMKRSELALMKLLRSIMEGKDAYGLSLEHWRLSIKDIFIPEDLPFFDSHLLYLAQSTPNLESLIILRSRRITRRGFAEAISSWKSIKHIGFEHYWSANVIKNVTEILEENGKSFTDITAKQMNHIYL